MCATNYRKNRGVPPEGGKIGCTLMARRLAAGIAAALVLLLVLAGIDYRRDRTVREALYAALAPTRITNCELQRFGRVNDGGYLMCGNLLTPAQAVYSYGIDGDDAWGCDVAGPLNLPLHQYDCFNTTAPRCSAPVRSQFHAECVGPERATIEGRVFDTVASHIDTNGDTGKRLIVKMDVEGSEWRSLATAPDHVLNAIDQLAIEFHRVEDRGYLDTAARLNEYFYVAHLHYNNYDCRPGFEPFAGPVFEALLVNKRMAVTNPWVDARGPSPLDAPNNPAAADCQAPAPASEPWRVASWLYRKFRGALALL
jgi:hypothetical protein